MRAAEVGLGVNGGGRRTCWLWRRGRPAMRVGRRGWLERCLLDLINRASPRSWTGAVVGGCRVRSPQVAVDVMRRSSRRGGGLGRVRAAAGLDAAVLRSGISRSSGLWIGVIALAAASNRGGDRR